MTKKQLDESVAHLKTKGFDTPEIGIVLGTGLGKLVDEIENPIDCLLYTSPSPRDRTRSRMPSSA